MKSNQIQSNPIHEWIQSMSNSGPYKNNFHIMDMSLTTLSS